MRARSRPSPTTAGSTRSGPGAPDESIHLVFNGTDLRRFSPRAGRRAASIRATARNMIFACRQLFPRKGIRFLIEAAAQLKPRFPDLKVVVAGDGFERPELIKLAERLGIGDRTSPSSAGCPTPSCRPTTAPRRVSVIPSLEEGFGIPAAEAMGCETPVVASDAGGLPEVVEHGVTGLIVPRGDSAALAEAIGVPARRSRAAPPTWDAPAGSARCGCSTGIGPPSSSSRSTRRRREGWPVTDRLFAFRWDVDHRVCITDGLPRIRAVCRDFGVPNTFFVNLGRSTNLREWLGKGISRSQGQAGRPRRGAPDQEDRVAPVPGRDGARPPGRARASFRRSRRSRPRATSSDCTAAWTT